MPSVHGNYSLLIGPCFIHQIMDGVNVNKPAKPASTSRRVVIVLIDGANPIDVTGPSTAFATANRFVPYSYDIIHACADGGTVVTESDLHITNLTPIADIKGPIDTIILTGGDAKALYDAASNEHLREWMQHQSRNARRYGSVCTGAFLLAAFGLAKHRNVVTHWASCELLKELFPDVTVDPTAMYIFDEKVFSSAGVTGAIDLTLALIEEDLGHQIASKVAKSMVLFLRRPGGQSQFSEMLVAQSETNGRFNDLIAWIAANLTADLRVSALARRVNMSERSFTRRFSQETRLTPAALVKKMRLEAACRWLETTDWPIKKVAETSGFGSVDALERTIRNEKGVTPSELRTVFGCRFSKGKTHRCD